MAFKWVKSFLVFAKLFWYYRKIIAKSADHDISVFV